MESGAGRVQMECMQSPADGARGSTSCALAVDPGLLAEVVTEEIARRLHAGDAGVARAYRGDADRLYCRRPDERALGFAELDARWFGRLGLDAPVRAAASRHPALLARLPSLTLSRALQADDEGADLGRPRDGSRPAVVRVRSARWEASGELTAFLDHELLRLGDLLDPHFGHDADALLAVPAFRRRIVQQRYRLAWSATLDARLARAGRVALATRGEHRERLARCFSGLPAASFERLFAAVWGSDRPTHDALLAVAKTVTAAGPFEAGAPCPLCEFPTHAWRRPTEPALIDAVRRDVPAWRPDQGLCDRCEERYQARGLAAGVREEP